MIAVNIRETRRIFEKQGVNKGRASYTIPDQVGPVKWALRQKKKSDILAIWQISNFLKTLLGVFTIHFTLRMTRPHPPLRIARTGTEQWSPDLHLQIRRNIWLLANVISFFRNHDLTPGEAAEALAIPEHQIMQMADSPTGCLLEPKDIKLGWDTASFCAEWEKQGVKKRLTIGGELVVESHVAQWEKMVAKRREKILHQRQQQQMRKEEAVMRRRTHQNFAIFSMHPQSVRIAPEMIRRRMENVALTTEIVNGILEALETTAEAARYSEEFYKFAFVLRAKSLKSYELLRRVLPFPTKANIHRKFRADFVNETRKLTDRQCISQRIQDFISTRTEECIMASLLMDAAALAVFRRQRFDSVRGGDSNRVREEYCQAVDANRHFFVLILAPVDYQIPCQILHIWPSTDGHVHNDTLALVSEVWNHCNVPPKLTTRFLITDGDVGTNALHSTAYEKIEKCRTIDDMMKVAKGEQFWPLTDILHAAKCARSRIVKHTVSLSSPFLGAFNAEKLEHNLKLGRALTDKSTIAKMRDKYPLQIFNFQNSLLLKDKEPVASFYVLIWALMLSVFRHPQISQAVRIFMCDLTLSFLRHVMQTLDAVPGLSQKDKSSSKVLTFFDAVTIKRLTSTMIGVRLVLKSKQPRIAMHRLTTQAVENLFGNYREGSFHYYTWKSAERWVTKTVMLAREMEFLDLRPRIRTRDSVGGTRINTTDVENQTGIRVTQLPVPYIDPVHLARLYFTASVQYFCRVNGPTINARNAFQTWIRMIVTESDFTDSVCVTDRTTDSGLNGVSILSRYISQGQTQETDTLED